MKILCTICARKGSKGLKNKNLIKLKNKPLYMHTFNFAKKVNFIDHIVVSTDSKQIKNKVGNLYSWFLRPKKLSGDNVSKIEVIKDAVLKSEKKHNCKYEYVIDLDVSSPLRNMDDMINSYKKFIQNKYENLFSVTEASKNPYFNMIEYKNKFVKTVNYKKKYNSRQKAPKVYSMNASIYLWKKSVLFSKNPLFNKKTGIYIMPKERSFDIDDIIDFKIVKCLSS